MPINQNVTKSSVLLRLAEARSGARACDPQRVQTCRGRKFISVIAITCLSSTWGGCGTAKVTSRNEITAASTVRPTTIYVADFDLDAANVKSERGFLPAPPKLPGPLGDMLPPPPGAAKDPGKVAHDVVDSMSRTLVKDLTKAGFNAKRITSASLYATNGWLIRGVFTDVNQGNQLQRAVIGFGLGKTDLQVNVDISDLSQGPPKPFYELKTAADSGKAPGAGPTIVLGPAGIAARYVIAGKDLDRNVKQTASKVAEAVAQRTKGT
jgi:hypothetical protein